MVIITFPNGSEWFNPNWAFRQLIADVANVFPSDAEVELNLQKAQAFGHLALNAIDPVVASRIMNAFRTVADETLAGRILGWKADRPDDEAGHAMYLEAIQELSNLLISSSRGN
jgi:hypothetical protein